MKLDHKCVRDILIFFEENLKYGYYFEVNSTEINNYDKEDIIYAADKLLEAEFINATRQSYGTNESPTIYIYSITWEGHKFLDNIRDEAVWKETNKIVSNFSSVSLGVIGNVATQIITTLINKQLGL